MKCTFVLVFVALFSTNLYSQRISWYFPEYKFNFRPDSSCNQKAGRSIQSWQYLKVRVYDSCRYVEISCYNSKDSSLKERGLYYNTNKIVEYNSRGRQAGSDSSFVTKRQHIVFKRVGTWKFYNKAGRVIKTTNYKKEE